MQLFEKQIRELRLRLAGRRASADIALPFGYPPWPRGGGGRLILEQDMGAELGGARLRSFASVLWTEDLGLVEHGTIRVYGADIPRIAAPGGQGSAPFGKLALLGVSPIGADSMYPAYEMMDAVRFRLDLDGYMLRGFPQRSREWSRISREACGKGFSFFVLGSELIRDYCRLPFVCKAEMLFFTDDAVIRDIYPLADECIRITNAMNTVFEKVEMDCVNCGSPDICAAVDLRTRGTARRAARARMNNE